MRQIGTFFLLFIAFFITHTAGAQTDTIPVKDSLPLLHRIPYPQLRLIPLSKSDTVPRPASVNPELMGILDAKIQKNISSRISK